MSPTHAGPSVRGRRHDGRLCPRVAPRSRVGACSVWIVAVHACERRVSCRMSVFSDAELTYLAKGKLGRLATIDATGMPHVVPLGWRYNPETDAIDIGGRNFGQSRKFRNAPHNPKVALVINDVLPPWRPRTVMTRGTAEALQN